MPPTDGPPAFIVLGRSADGPAAALLGPDGAEIARRSIPSADLAGWIRTQEEASAPRWVWSDAATWYPAMLAAGIRLARCHDLRLAHAILRDSAFVRSADALREATEWDRVPDDPTPPAADALFALDDELPTGPPDGLDDALAEFARQRAALADSADPGRLRLLVAAESAGALVAQELRAAGLPWDAAAHDAILEGVLGSRVSGEPAHLAAAAARVRGALGDPTASLDSPPKLLRALHRVGVLVESTSRWELASQEHPVIEPLREYKKLARLLTANGWNWLDQWVHDGRFRPVYVPAGVVTGRWASSGGGALQIPRQLRSAVRADPGWRLVIADVAQLEPRVLAAMARDERLAEAARGRDLYEGIVATGALQNRAQAKVALLGAMYGATSGESGRLAPRLRRTYPAAMGLVDAAARTGEDGGIVSTLLGRSSPAAPAAWTAAQAAASGADGSAADIARARRWARDRGRFTRNFVVQGTAAEWALSWLADLRTRLWQLPEVPNADAASRSGAVFARRAHLAFFLHDEILVHTPAALADEVAEAVRASAASAGRLLFGGFPVDFPLDLRIAETAEKA